MKKIIFIIGVGRSGTTLIQSILHAHSEIEFSPETHFVKRYIRHEVKKNLYGWDKAEILKEKLIHDKNLSESKKDIVEVLEKSILDKPNQYLTGSFFYNFLDSDNVQYIGDKDPMNVNYLSIIKKAFPDAKIIHIIRDPRDVVSSRLKSKWGRKESVLWHASEYKFGILKARREGTKLFGNNYIEVKYEQLLTSTEKELKKVCSFLSLSFETEMMNHQKNAKTLLRNDELDWKASVLEPVDPTKIGKWEENLSVNQLNRVESILSNIILDLGYEKSSENTFVFRFYHALVGYIYSWIFKIKFR